MQNDNKLIIQWDPSFEVGIPYIDNQHKHLVNLCILLYKNITTEDINHRDKWLSSLAYTIKECIQYVKYHFSSEEKLMLASNFDGYAHHKQEHNAFTNKVLEISNNYRTWQYRDAVDFVKFLYDWILNHVAGEDKLYIETFKEYEKTHQDAMKD